MTERMTLFENDNIFGKETKVLVLFEESLGLLASRPACHDIPWDDDGALGLLAFGLCDGLETGDALCLVLEKRLVGGEADVVTALRC